MNSAPGFVYFCQNLSVRFYSGNRSTTNPDRYTLFFVRANETATISVKEGEYIIKYTTGLTWYGTEEMFGSTASFTQADDVF